jgi:hypothetical protein
MIHVAIHLPREAELAGLVQFYWMYPIERCLGKYKQFVRNRAHLEGSIADGYLSIECWTFCFMYLCGIETKWTREEQNSDRWQEGKSKGLSMFSQRLCPLGAAKFIKPEDKVLIRA